jgi:predicted DNA-binding protein
MEPLTIRVPEDLRESLDSEASEYGVSVSEYVRELIEQGREYDELEERLTSKEQRISDLEEQLAKRSQIQQEIEDLPDKIRDTETYSERRRRLLDEASLTQRLKWKVTGVPVDVIDEERGSEK